MNTVINKKEIKYLLFDSLFNTNSNGDFVAKKKIRMRLDVFEVGKVINRETKFIQSGIYSAIIDMKEMISNVEIDENGTYVINSVEKIQNISDFWAVGDNLEKKKAFENFIKEQYSHIPINGIHYSIQNGRICFVLSVFESNVMILDAYFRDLFYK
jgi:hypothetical protein